MRTIRFRSWSAKNKTMSKPFGLDEFAEDQDGEYGGFNIPTGWELSPIEIEKGIAPDILMQYTGFKDRNGTDIYEGDILKDKLLVSPEMSLKWHEEDEKIFEVKLPDFFLQLGRELQHTDETLEQFVGYMEVIGNMYENPELLHI